MYFPEEQNAHIFREYWRFCMNEPENPKLAKPSIYSVNCGPALTVIMTKKIAQRSLEYPGGLSKWGPRDC